MAIFTSRFSNPELKNGNYKTIRISIGTPKWNTGYRLDGELSDLMPFNLKGMEYEVFQKEYKARLEKIGVEKIKSQLKHLQTDGKDIVLLCYEDIRKPDDWCHRTIFASWWLEKTGETILELSDSSSPPKQRTQNTISPEQMTLEF